MTDTTEDLDSDAQEEVTKKPVKEVPVVQDRGFFVHETGDTYEGFFEAKKKDRTAKMHGPGVYTTAEGDAYSGYWDNDRLGANAEVTVAFTDGSRYEGMFKEWCFAGRGRYVYPDGSVVFCDFVENCPSGNLTLTDPNGHLWLGKAETGYGWFEPVNHYYHMLEKTRESRVQKPMPEKPTLSPKTVKNKK